MKNVQDIYELSPLQWGMLFGSLREPTQGFYVQQHSSLLHGEWAATVLREAFECLVRRHGVLRTSFVWQRSERPVQVVFERVRLPWRQFDLSGLNQADRTAILARFQSEDQRRGFILDRAPLMRVTLLRMTAGTFRLVWTHHHAVLDGWSVTLAVGALFSAAEVVRAGRPLAITEPSPYQAFIAWIRSRETGEDERFWRFNLRDLQRSSLLAQRKGEVAERHERELRLTVALPLTERLQRLARNRRLTMSAIVHAAWALAIYAQTGQTDVVIGSAVTVRPSGLPAITEALGLYLNTVPLRYRVLPTQRLDKWLETSAERPELRQHAHTALRDIERWVAAEDEDPLFDSLVVFESYPQIAGGSSRALGFDVVDVVHAERTSFPLTLFVDPGPELRLRWAYDASRIDSARVTGLASSLLATLELQAASPNALVQECSIEARAEDRLREWNATQVELPLQTLSSGFAESVARAPDSVALVLDDHSVTYAELGRRASLFAANLCARGLAREQFLGVCLERSIDAIVAVLAILEIGAAYVPLDPAYPNAHLKRIAVDAGLSVVVTSMALAGRCSELPLVTVFVDGPWTKMAAPDDGPRQPTPEDRAYVVYTSGSTGEPKGVLAHHRGAVNRIRWLEQTFPFATGEACCQTTSLNFVDSVAEIFGALLAGVRLVIAPRRTMRDVGALAHLVESQGVTRVVLVPALLDALLESEAAEPERLSTVTLWISSGDVLRPQQVDRFFRLLPASRLLNLYGSSEVAGDVAYQRVSPRGETWTPVPIGRAIDNSQLYVLDRNLNPLPIGAGGEIYVSGTGLAHGYVKRPAETATAFVPNPFPTSPGQRLYRTGDLGRWLCDGSLELSGRRDRQVKVRGHRVELATIEAALRRSPQLADAAVTARSQPSDAREPCELGASLSLVAWVVPTGATVDERELARTLTSELPDYMAPTEFIITDRLPYTPNGKLDRRRLNTEAGLSSRRTPASRAARVLAVSSTEAKLCELWMEAIGRPVPDFATSLLSTGGDSLSLLRLAARVRQTFDVELPISYLYTSPDIAGLAAHVDELRRRTKHASASAVAFGTIERAAGQEFPLSPAQQGVWLAERLGSRGAYCEPAAIRIEGKLAIEALSQAIAALSVRHEALRTVFVESDGRPVQRLLGALKNLTLGIVDCGSYGSAAASSNETTDWVPDPPRFSLSRGPLLRALLRCSAVNRFELYIVAHHLVTDGWSGGVIIREVIAYYEALCAGLPPPPLPALPLRHVDYVMWQHRLLESGAFASQIDRWRRDQSTDAMKDIPREGAAGGENSVGALHLLHIPRALTGDLKRLAAREQVTLFTVLLTAFAVVHSLGTARSRVIIGTDFANRRQVDLENVVGLFVNQSGIRVDVTGDPRLDELLARVHRALLAAHADQDLPFETLLSGLSADSVRRGPLFDVKIVMQPQSLDSVRVGDSLFQNLPLPRKVAKFDLLFNVYPREEGLLVEVTHRPAHFAAARALGYGRHFQTVLAQFADDPRATLASVAARIADDDRRDAAGRLSQRRSLDRERLGIIQRSALPKIGERLDDEV